MEAAGIAPVSLELQLTAIKDLMAIVSPCAAYVQQDGVAHGHPLTHTELEIVFILARWQSLPVHIRQTILILIQSLEPTFIVAQLPFKT